MENKIYLVATPIGNLEDMTKRAVKVLESVDIIAAEDTRNTRYLLNHFGIKATLTSYHEFNKIEKAYELIEKVREGKSVALVTDAGMPAISDPGEELVRIAYEEGIEVTIIPGASAVACALAVSGLPTRRFSFEGFLPRDKKERQRIFRELEAETRTIILYEAPHRLEKTLAELLEVLGNRKLSIVRELTKVHEDVYVTTLTQAIDAYQSGKLIKGEYVLVIEGKSLKEKEKEQIAIWEEMPIEEHLNMYIAQGMERKEAMKRVAKERGLSKRDVYQAVL